MGSTQLPMPKMIVTDGNTLITKARDLYVQKNNV